MKCLKFLLILTLLMALLSGCQNHMDTTKDNGSDLLVNSVIADGRRFTTTEINADIKNTFNSVLYYRGDHDAGEYLESNKKLVLGKDLDYELYFESNSNRGLDAIIDPPQVHLLITNVRYPYSPDGSQGGYDFSIEVTKWGLRSDFYTSGGPTSREEFSGWAKEDGWIYLGSHTMHLDKITKPHEETMSEKWKEDTKKEIQMYINKFYGTKSADLAPDDLSPGNYHIYVQKFSKSDADSTIIFENENGKVYTGFYYFVHFNSGKSFADLNQVVLVNDSRNAGIDESFRKYLEKVKSDPAVSLEYAIK